MASQVRSSDKVKASPSWGLHECQRSESEVASGTARATRLIAGRGLSACPCTPPGRQAAASGGSLFTISDSSGWHGSALCGANTGLAHSCREALSKVSLGREDAGVDAASTILDRLGGTFCGHSDGPHVACLLRPCSRPLSRSAARGQADQAFFSPACACTRDQAEAYSRERGLCERRFLPAAGVCRGRSDFEDVITHLRTTGRSPRLPLGLSCFRSVQPSGQQVVALKRWLRACFSSHVGHWASG